MMTCISGCFGGLSEQRFRDLHSVQRGPFEQLIPRHEHRDGLACRITEVCTDTTNEDILNARGFRRHREMVRVTVIDKPTPAAFSSCARTDSGDTY